MVDSAVLQGILTFGPVFILIAVRAFAMIQVAPLFSSESIPIAVKFALAGFAAFAVLPAANYSDVVGDMLFLDSIGLQFFLLIIGEAMIGLIMGFYLTIIFTTFSTAGQFFTLQMGFGASETFDPLSQIENPLMGQFLNLISMLVFIAIDGFQRFFVVGFWRSVQTINVVSLIHGREPVISMLVSGLAQLFLDAFIISLPILGTLFLTSLTTGLISKAAPQINILAQGFPIAIMVAFLIILVSLPFMIDAFARVLDSGFRNIESLYAQIGRPITAGGY